MARHTFTEDALNYWLVDKSWRQFAASFGGDSAKKFETDGEAYRVTDHDEVIYFGGDKTAAIAAYNEAQ